MPGTVKYSAAPIVIDEPRIGFLCFSSFLLSLFFPQCTELSSTKSCTNCDDKREIYDIFCYHSSVLPTLPMKLEVAVEAKAEASAASLA